MAIPYFARGNEGIPMMENSPQSYEIIVDGNIVNVKTFGPFSQDSAKAYQYDMQNVIKQLKDKSWATLVTYQDSGIFTPEAEIVLTELTVYRAKFGMVANASVFYNSKVTDIQQMQLSRIYEAAKIPFHVFSEIDSAKNWLNYFLEQSALKK